MPGGICTVENCDEIIRSGNVFCEKHRARWRRHGDPNIVKVDHTPAAQRWKKCYIVDERTGCWNWTGPKSLGYGFITEGAKKRHKAHTFVYSQLVGPVPDGKELDHLCRNTLCVNPDHLEPVTHLVNVQRGNAGINNSSKTHCVHGHEFTEENTIMNAKGRRNCRTCQRRLVREAMRRRRARSQR